MERWERRMASNSLIYRKWLRNFWNFVWALNLSREIWPLFCSKRSLDKARILGNSVLADRWQPDFPSLLSTWHFCQEKTVLFQMHIYCTCKMSSNLTCDCAKVTKRCRFSKQSSFNIRPTRGWTFTLSEFVCFFRNKRLRGLYFHAGWPRRMAINVFVQPPFFGVSRKSEERTSKGHRMVYTVPLHTALLRNQVCEPNSPYLCNNRVIIWIYSPVHILQD